MEPHERRSVYIGTSLVSGGGEGIFARRSFLPGELVSFFNGVRVTEEMMFRDNMTKVGELMMIMIIIMVIMIMMMMIMMMMM